MRPTARRLSEPDRARAQALFQGTAEGNAVVVQRLLADDGSPGECADCAARGGAGPPGATCRGRCDRARRDGARHPDANRIRREARPNRRRAHRCFCSWRCSATRGASSSKPFCRSRRTIAARASRAAFTHFGGVVQPLLGDHARAVVTYKAGWPLTNVTPEIAFRRRVTILSAIFLSSLPGEPFA